MKTRSYHELSRIESFEDRFEYLKMGGVVGESTFGFDRHLNQAFYRSAEWRRIRRDVVVRDMSNDLGVVGHPLLGPPVVHHMNPITAEDLTDFSEWILDPNFLICTSHDTHNAIHYGDASLLPKEYVPRRPNDTKLW